MADENDSKDNTQEEQQDQKSVAEMSVEEAEAKDAKKVKDLRSEAAKYRTQKKEVEQEYDKFKSKVQKLFGDDDDQDFESQVNQLKQENQRLKQESVIRKFSSKLNLDSELVTAKVMYDNAFDGIDLSKPKEVENVLKELAEQNPRLVAGSTKVGDAEKTSDDKKSQSMNDFIRNF